MYGSSQDERGVDMNTDKHQAHRYFKSRSFDAVLCSAVLKYGLEICSRYAPDLFVYVSVRAYVGGFPG